jgi:hypothetical protein
MRMSATEHEPSVSNSYKYLLLRLVAKPFPASLACSGGVMPFT